MNQIGGKFIPYPELKDSDFYKKVYSKKEFYDTKPPVLPDPSDQSVETLQNIFRLDGDFRLLPQQRFLRNYISEATPYNGILVYHSTGTGKTCSAISIAERFRNRVDDTGKRIMIVVGRNIRDEFIKTIFNFDKEATKRTERQVVQCTGRTYQLGAETKYMTERQKRNLIEKTIRSYYEIVGHGQLVNQAKRISNWDGKEESVTEKVRQRLSDYYSNRVIIVDEVHNRIGTEDQDDSTPLILKTIIASSTNIKLVLMSATPMVNSATDILFTINLLRSNDKRPIINQKDIFNKNGSLLPKGKDILREGSKGYVSYVRGGDSPRFPYELVPPEAQVPKPEYQLSGKKIPTNEKMKDTKLILCHASKYHFETYQSVIANEEKTDVGGLYLSATQASNIIFPSQNKEGFYGNEGYGSKTSSDHPLLEQKEKKNIIYSYAPFAEGFFLDKNIGKYSIKFKEIYSRIKNSIGISYVYSEYLKGGVLSLALMLEENGFIPAKIMGYEVPLLRSKTKKSPICYMCGEERHPPKEDHRWSPAKYVLFTGSQELRRAESAKISGYLNRKDNMYGKLAKVLLGSKISGEGIDFKRIRQVHIMEPWFNDARLEQVKGRAIRNGSHIDLPPNQRNVEVFKYCLVPPKEQRGKLGKTETIDERNYRYSENKDRKIKEVRRVLKEAAVDCLFQKYNNIRKVHRNIRLEDSRGRMITFVTGDKPYSSDCDYMKSCDYNCVWNPSKEVIVDKSTYGPEFADADIGKAREHIQELFKKNIAVDILGIINYVISKERGIEKVYIFLALESLMNPDGNYIITDKYKRTGYLIERGDLYIFQPFTIVDTFAPIEYRIKPLESKPIDAPFPIISREEIEEENNKLLGIPDKSIDEIIILFHKMYKKIKKILSVYFLNNHEYDSIITNMILDTLPDKWAITLLKGLLHPDFFEKSDKQKKEIGIKILGYYNFFGNIMLNDFKGNERRAVMIGEHCFQWGRSTYGLKRTKDRGGWGKCDADVDSYLDAIIRDRVLTVLWEKIPNNLRPVGDDSVSRSEYIHIARQSGVLSSYVGTVEATNKDISGRKQFKILDFTREDTIERKDKRKSKRSEIRGRVCSTFQNKYLFKLLGDIEKIVLNTKGINIKMNNTKKSKVVRMAVCTRIEFLLRLLNEKTDKIWFYRSMFEDIE